MSTSHRKDDETLPPPNRSTVLLLLGTIGDTTWRMFATVIIGLAAGIYGDRIFHTYPLLILTGVLAGCAGAGLLIRQQLKKVNNK